MRHASGLNDGKPAADAESLANSRKLPGIPGQCCPVSGSILSQRYPARSVTQPYVAQFVSATDIRKPPGVIMCRKGASLLMACITKANSVSRPSAKPFRMAVPGPRRSRGSPGSRIESKSVDIAYSPSSRREKSRLPCVYALIAACLLRGEDLHGKCLAYPEPDHDEQPRRQR